MSRLIRVDSIPDDHALRQLLHTDNPGEVSPRYEHAQPGADDSYMMLRRFIRATGRTGCVEYTGDRYTVLEVDRPLRLGLTRLRSWGKVRAQVPGWSLTIRAAAGVEWPSGQPVVDVGPMSGLEGLCVDANGVAPYAVRFNGTERSRNIECRGGVYFRGCQVARFENIDVKQGAASIYACNGTTFRGLSVTDSPGVGVQVGRTNMVGPDGDPPPQGEGGCVFTGLHIERCQSHGLETVAGSVVAVYGGHIEGAAKAGGWAVYQRNGTLRLDGMMLYTSARGEALIRCDAGARQLLMDACQHTSGAGGSGQHRVELADSGTRVELRACRYRGSGADLAVVQT